MGDPPQVEPASSVQSQASDPGELMCTCANCGSAEERTCKVICTGCGFLSCSDYS